MYCPSCGLGDKGINQFCRACGADLRKVHQALAKADDITSSAAGARDEIGKAFAARIRELETSDDLKKAAEEVLPQIEKFLESPAERKLRWIRTGTTVSFIGLGAAIGFAVFGGDLLFLSAFALAALFLGLSFILNGYLFILPKPALEDKSPDAANQLDLDSRASDTNELILPEGAPLFSSVTETTTKNLAEKQPVARR